MVHKPINIAILGQHRSNSMALGALGALRCLAQVAETWIMFLVVRISTDPSQSQEQVPAPLVFPVRRGMCRGGGEIFGWLFECIISDHIYMYIYIQYIYAQYMYIYVYTHVNIYM